MLDIVTETNIYIYLLIKFSALVKSHQYFDF